ncbi:hypothetical protein JCGZ_19102 [Jatropha curcas]|uniref:DEAD-box ATP-dependent RNA helicase 50 n=1 Tax=Jatropha curcas TaxID=180498 RepID=A0A067JVV3_JATCU|nr:DEAD-box ATP-dependent RNA helicase 50 isoform X2 [Jatropha curcas]KDP28022.1 hypothetical protein JCGZ_19102 [Jatropha curcas]
MLTIAPPHPLSSFRLQITDSHSQSHRGVVFDYVSKSGAKPFALVRAACSSTRLNTPFQSVTELADGGGVCSHSPNKEDEDATSGAVTKTANPTAGSKRLSGNFRKLKAQKVKFLMMKQKVRKHADVSAAADADFDTLVTSYAKSDSTDKSCGDEMATRRGEKMKVSSSNKKLSEYQTLDYEIMPDKPVKSIPRRAGTVHAGSSSYRRGWGNVGLESQSANPLQRKHKFSAQNDFFSRKSFRDLGCSQFMMESLKQQSFLRPSNIQAMAFTPVIEGKCCVIADQSGSGKTLAYLIPVIQRLRLEELQGLGESLSQNPRVLIMVPTAELASQVLNNCRSMSKFGVPFRSMAATGGFSQRTQLQNLEQGVDILIVTPGRFLFLIKEGFLKLTNLKCSVLDEVDILFKDDDFEFALQSLMNSSPLATQYLFVTATLPVDVYNKLIEIFPDCEMIMGPSMHRTSTRLEEVLVDCSGEIGTERTPETAFVNKKHALLQLMEQSPVSKTIVFCNKIETCRKVENVLKRFDRKGAYVRVLPFHAALAQDSRVANMKEFMNYSSGGCSLFLVCTDRASRGIDFTGVDHVILFDFPRDPSEYVRRVGRTARGAVGKGKAFIFVVGKQVSLAQKIIDRNRKGHPLHDVPSAYELMS